MESGIGVADFPLAGAAPITDGERIGAMFGALQTRLDRMLARMDERDDNTATRLAALELPFAAFKPRPTPKPEVSAARAADSLEHLATHAHVNGPDIADSLRRIAIAQEIQAAIVLVAAATTAVAIGWYMIAGADG